jgi:hypothetical protein
MSSFKKYIPLALLIGFFIFGLDAFLQSKPESKNPRVYKTVQEYSPYYMDIRFGGLQIMNKEDPEFKEKPTNMTVHKEFARLEKEWGKKHMKIDNNVLIISDNNDTVVEKLPLQTNAELDFARKYYGL